MTRGELITILSRNSDAYGYPHLVGFMDDYGVKALREATTAQLGNYIRRHKLCSTIGD